MSNPDVVEQLRHQLNRCRAPRRNTVITARWSRTHPSLTGHSIDDIVECCRRRSTAQNPIVAALIELHQSGDFDASTVLLSVCEPIIYGLTKHRVIAADQGIGARSRRSGDDNYWAALGHVLATITPDEPTNGDGEPKVFLAHIGAMVTNSRRCLDASARRKHRFDHGYHDDSRFVALTDVIMEDEQHRWIPAGSCVEDAALNSIELDRIADVVRSGLIATDKWRQLIAHRVDHTRTATGRDRVAAHRTARRLAELVGHAA